MELITETVREEVVTDLEFNFVGSPPLTLTLREDDRYDSLTGVIFLKALNGTITIRYDHLLWYSQRTRVVHWPSTAPAPAQSQPSPTR